MKMISMMMLIMTMMIMLELAKSTEKDPNIS